MLASARTHEPPPRMGAKRGREQTGPIPSLSTFTAVSKLPAGAITGQRARCEGCRTGALALFARSRRAKCDVRPPIALGLNLPTHG